MTKAKCRLHNEGEKVFIDFEFDSICSARGFFQNAENLEDIIDALNYDLETEEKPEEVKGFESQKEQARANLAKTLGKLPKEIIEDLADLLQEVSSKNK